MDTEKIYKQLKSYCNKAERCPMDVVQWLRKKEIDECDSRPFIERLEEEGLLDEERFIRAFASDKLRFSHWGYYKIKNELRMRELSERKVEQIVTQVMEEEGEEEILNRLLEKKITLRLNELLDSEASLDLNAVLWKIIDHFAQKGFRRSVVEKQCLSIAQGIIEDWEKGTE